MKNEDKRSLIIKSQDLLNCHPDVLHPGVLNQIKRYNQGNDFCVLCFLGAQKNVSAGQSGALSPLSRYILVELYKSQMNSRQLDITICQSLEKEATVCQRTSVCKESVRQA